MKANFLFSRSSSVDVTRILNHEEALHSSSGCECIVDVCRFIVFIKEIPGSCSVCVCQIGLDTSYD